jgi:hypothetical protein
LPGVPPFAGGKSFGARIVASSSSRSSPGRRSRPDSGFPLHPPGKPSTTRQSTCLKSRADVVFAGDARCACRSCTDSGLHRLTWRACNASNHRGRRPRVSRSRPFGTHRCASDGRARGLTAPTAASPALRAGVFLIRRRRPRRLCASGHAVRDPCGP